MRSIEIVLLPEVNCDDIERAIDRAIAGSGLTVTLRDTLRKFPGCVHWHLKNGRESGTLEVTLWPAARRAWFSVQSAREGEWIVEMIGALQEKIREFVGA